MWAVKSHFITFFSLCLSLSLLGYLSVLPPTLISICFYPYIQQTLLKALEKNHKNMCQRDAQPTSFTNIQTESWFELNWDALPH